MLWCQEYVQLNIFQMLRNDLKYTNLQVVLHMHHRTVRASSTQFAGATIYKHQWQQKAFNLERWVAFSFVKEAKEYTYIIMANKNQ